jgi:hypothetical protein
MIETPNGISSWMNISSERWETSNPAAQPLEF